jgi:CspA family cold shock protein
LKVPTGDAPPANWSEDDLALVKQGVGDKTGRPAQQQAEQSDSGGGPQPGEQTGQIVKYFDDKGFGFIRPDGGGRDVFFHISRLTEGDSTALVQNARVVFEMGMDRMGKMAATSLRIAPEQAPEG